MTTVRSLDRRPARDPAAAADQQARDEASARARRSCSSSSALAITLTVLFPILWIFSLALDPRNISRPDSLIPPGASLDAFARVIAQPTSDPISFLELARNSFVLASSVALFSVADRRPGGLRVLAPPLPRPRGADDRRSSAC